IKRNIKYLDYKWDAIGFKQKIKDNEIITVGQFTILEVDKDYVEDYLVQLLYLKNYEKKRKKNAVINALLIAPGFANGIETYCNQNGIQWIQFYEKPKNIEKWEGIVSDKQIYVPNPIKISDKIPVTQKDKRNELEKVLKSLTATKIREIAKRFHIKKIYGIKKQVLINNILQELPEKIEEEIAKLK
ncbi:MAG: hypothetical protein ACTSWG_00680, partial [Candidatus Helarchaeota archaeon]